MNAAALKQLTLRLDRVLTAMAARAKEDRPLGFFATVYQVPRADLQAWMDRCNDGASKLLPARLVAVKRELGILVEAPARPAPGLPANTPPAAGPAARVKGGPGDDVGRWLDGQGARLQGTVRTHLVQVTPALAAAWLKLNVGNRRPSAAKVRRFGFALREGQWRVNGETVKFSVTGRLLDGQSRLQAIVDSGVAAVLEVRGGLADEAQRCMDCGEARRGTHVLEMLGERHAAVLSPALRLLFQWENGALGGSQTRGRPSVLENLAVPGLLERHAVLRASVQWALDQGGHLRRLMPPSEGAFFHYVFTRADARKASQFFQVLLSPAAAEPVAVALLRLRLAVGSDGGRLQPRVRIKLIVKAWNAHARGDRIRELVLAPREGVAAIHGAKEAA